MTNTWIVVADEAKARVLSLSKLTEPLVEFKTSTSSEAKMLDRELVSDKSGTSHGGSGQGRHSVGERHENKEQYEIRFAKEIGDYLEENRQTNTYSKLIIIAAPRFLGVLRKVFTKGVLELITLEVDKDLTMMDTQVIKEYLPPYL